MKKSRLLKSLCEKDLGIYVDIKLSFEYHITKIAKKGNQMAGQMLWRIFQYTDEDIFKTVYERIVRCTSLYPVHLEAGRRTGKGAEEGYTESSVTGGTQIWRAPQEIEAANIDLQKNTGWPDKSLQLYEQHLWLQHWNISHSIWPAIWFPFLAIFVMWYSKLKKCKTRGHNKKIKKLHSRLNPRHYYFSQRVTDWWNKLSKEVTTAPSVDSFRNRLDHHFRDHPMMYDYRALNNPVSC